MTIKLSGIYAALFSSGRLSKMNKRILNTALRARGYNNYRNSVESGERYFIEKVLSPSNPILCIDIGANIGNYSKELLEKTNAKVISFEPMPKAYQELKRKVIKYGERAIIENKGVGSENKNLIIHYSPKELAHASFLEEVKNVSYVTNEMKEEVPVVTLDSYCFDNKITEIDFVKIDTEGFEAEVFNGALKTFSEIRPKYIQIEFNWHQLFRNTSLNYFAEILTSYDVYQLIPNGWVKRDPKDPLSNIYLFSNFVFVRR